MSHEPVLRALGREMHGELTRRILPFWTDRGVDPAGGFVGCISGDGAADPDAGRGAILNARILWTFSAVHRAHGDTASRSMADRALAQVRDRFLDQEHGGVYWMLDAAGRPVDDRKHVYAQAFAVYALAEHYRGTGEGSSLDLARQVFQLLERHAHDGRRGGYREAFRRDWQLLEGEALSEVDLPAAKSENTHLHLLEAFTTLYRVWPDPLVATRLRSLIDLFMDRIVDADTGHTRPFFDEEWAVLSDVVSYGHDIETSWLLTDAADALGDGGVTERVRRTAVLLAEAVLEEGVDPVGGVFYEAFPDGTVDTGKEWWTQAEAVVGFLNAYQITGRPEFLRASCGTWQFVADHMLDHRQGEWYRRVDRDGAVQPQHEKVGPWKGPYHNGRACLEVARRSRELLGTAAADPVEIQKEVRW